MTQEEKQLLIKDLCARLPYGVKLLCVNGEVVTLVNPPIAIQDDCWNFKPYLRPLSSMTEEEKILMATTCLKYANGDVEGVVSELSDFYNSRHLDYHGLIGMGLALEAKEGMYGKI